MRIARASVRIIDIPMRHAVHHSLAVRDSARNILVELTGENGAHGWGECCPRPYVTGETVEGVLEFLTKTLLPGEFREIPDELKDAPAAMLTLLDGLDRNQHAAFCAAELAALDLIGKVTATSAGESIGPVCRGEVSYSGVIAGKQNETIKKQVQINRQLQVKHVKIKVGDSLSRNIEIVEQVRTGLGDGVSLRLDANCAWTAEEAIQQLEELSRFQIDGVEQPTQADDIDGLAQITEAGIVPVVVDESLCSFEDGKRLIERHACDVFNIRISKCGGLSNSARLHDLATDAGLSCQLGAQVGETGILSAAGRHLSTRHSDMLWCEGSYGELLLEKEIMIPDIGVGAGGVAHSLTTPGIGVVPDPHLLKQFTTHSLVAFSNDGGEKS